MLRPASSRNQRAKGFRLKHALQIGILVAICIWLLYQVKHSHDKKRAYDARNLKMATKAIENQEDFFNFGRKDLTRTEEAATANMDHKEEESEETQEEEEPEIKQEEEEPEIQQQETEDEEVRGAGDDAIDDQDKENNDDEAEDAEHVEDPIEEDDKEGQMEETDQSDSQDHEGGTRAREENYKRDDVSSAVVHDTRATESEAFTINAKGSDEEQTSDGSKVDNDSTSDGSKVGVAEDNMEEQEIETENVVNGTVDGSKVDNVTADGSTNNLSDAMKDNSTMPDGNLANNGTAADSALMSSSTRVEDTSQTNSLTNNTTEAESNDEMELSANSTSISVNQTEGRNDSTVDELPTDVQTSNGTVSLDSARDQNTTVDEGAQGEVESNLENIVDREEKSNSRTVLDSGEQSTTSSATNRNIVNRAGLGETNDKSHEVIEEGRETRTYLSTLPSIKHEAT